MEEWNRKFTTLWCWSRLYLSFKSAQAKARYLPQEKRADFWEKQHEHFAMLIWSNITKLRGWWVKVGQLLSTRSDLLPAPYVTHLAKLQDMLPAVGVEYIVSTINDELGPYQNHFRSIEPIALASASIAQVHKAYLINMTEVVIKVQHSDVARLLQSDMQSLKQLSWAFSFLEPELNFASILDEWHKATQKELDFRCELKNQMKVYEALKASGIDAIIPKCYPLLCSSKVLVMDFIEGFKINDIKKLTKYRVDKAALMYSLCDVFAYLLHMHGLLNGDPHPGNILVAIDKKTGVAVPVILDWGLVKEFSEGSRIAFSKLVYCLASMNVMGLLEALEDMGFKFKEGLAIDPKGYMEAIRDLLGDNQFQDTGSTQKLTSSTDTASSYKAQKDSIVSKNPLMDWPKELIFFVRIATLLHGLSIELDTQVPFLKILLKRAVQCLSDTVFYTSSVPSSRLMLPHPSQGVSSAFCRDNASTFNSKLELRLMKFLNDLIRQKMILGCQVAVQKDQKLVVNLATGCMGPVDMRPVQTDSLFCVYCASKGLLTTALLKLIDQERVLLDDYVCNWWDGFIRFRKHDITLRQILSHRAGLHRVFPESLSITDFSTYEKMIRILEDATPLTPRGTDGRYSYLAFGWLISEIVRSVSCLSIDEFLEKELLQELNIQDEVFLRIPNAEQLLSTSSGSSAPNSNSSNPGSLPSPGYFPESSSQKPYTPSDGILCNGGGSLIPNLFGGQSAQMYEVPVMNDQEPAGPTELDNTETNKLEMDEIDPFSPVRGKRREFIVPTFRYSHFPLSSYYTSSTVFNGNKIDRNFHSSDLATCPDLRLESRRKDSPIKGSVDCLLLADALHSMEESKLAKAPHCSPTADGLVDVGVCSEDEVSAGKKPHVGDGKSCFLSSGTMNDEKIVGDFENTALQEESILGVQCSNGSVEAPYEHLRESGVLRYDSANATVISSSVSSGIPGKKPSSLLEAVDTASSSISDCMTCSSMVVNADAISNLPAVFKGDLDKDRSVVLIDGQQHRKTQNDFFDEPEIEGLNQSFRRALHSPGMSSTNTLMAGQTAASGILDKTANTVTSLGIARLRDLEIEEGRLASGEDFASLSFMSSISTISRADTSSHRSNDATSTLPRQALTSSSGQAAGAALSFRQEKEKELFFPGNSEHLSKSSSELSDTHASLSACESQDSNSFAVAGVDTSEKSLELCLSSNRGCSDGANDVVSSQSWNSSSSLMMSSAARMSGNDVSDTQNTVCGYSSSHVSVNPTEVASFKEKYDPSADFVSQTEDDTAVLPRGSLLTEQSFADRSLEITSQTESVVEAGGLPGKVEALRGNFFPRNENSMAPNKEASFEKATSSLTKSCEGSLSASDAISVSRIEDFGNEAADLSCTQTCSWEALPGLEWNPLRVNLWRWKAGMLPSRRSPKSSSVFLEELPINTKSANSCSRPEVEVFKEESAGKASDTLLADSVASDLRLTAEGASNCSIDPLITPHLQNVAPVMQVMKDFLSSPAESGEGFFRNLAKRVMTCRYSTEEEEEGEDDDDADKITAVKLKSNKYPVYPISKKGYFSAFSDVASLKRRTRSGKSLHTFHRRSNEVAPPQSLAQHAQQRGYELKCYVNMIASSKEAKYLPLKSHGNVSENGTSLHKVCSDSLLVDSPKMKAHSEKDEISPLWFAASSEKLFPFESWASTKQNHLDVSYNAKNLCASLKAADKNKTRTPHGASERHNLPKQLNSKEHHDFDGTSLANLDGDGPVAKFLTERITSARRGVYISDILGDNLYLPENISKTDATTPKDLGEAGADGCNHEKTTSKQMRRLRRINALLKDSHAAGATSMENESCAARTEKAETKIPCEVSMYSGCEGYPRHDYSHYKSLQSPKASEFRYRHEISTSESSLKALTRCRRGAHRTMPKTNGGRYITEKNKETTISLLSPNTQEDKIAFSSTKANCSPPLAGFFPSVSGDVAIMPDKSSSPLPFTMEPRIGSDLAMQHKASDLPHSFHASPSDTKPTFPLQDQKEPPLLPASVDASQRRGKQPVCNSDAAVGKAVSTKNAGGRSSSSPEFQTSKSSGVRYSPIEMIATNPYIFDPLLYDSRYFLNSLIPPTNCRCTAKGLVKFYGALADGKIISKELLQEASKEYTTDRSLPTLLTSGGLSNSWGLGYQLYQCKRSDSTCVGVEDDVFRLNELQLKKDRCGTMQESKGKENANLVLGIGHGDLGGSIALCFPEVSLAITILLNDVFTGPKASRMILDFLLPKLGLIPEWNSSVNANELWGLLPKIDYPHVVASKEA